MADANGFPLSLLSPLLPELKVPAGPFDAQATWTSRYRTHCLVGNVKAPNGSVMLSRSKDGEDALLRVRCERRVGAGRVHAISGEVLCSTDQAATPRRWSYSTDSPSLRGAVFHAERKGLGEKTAGMLAHEWSLFDAIQRLPTRTFPKMQFQLLTCDGRLLPGHSLGYRGAVEVPVGGAPVRLHRYEHLGTGILPWIYYKSESGRILLAVSGLQAWLYDGDGA